MILNAIITNHLQCPNHPHHHDQVPPHDDHLHCQTVATIGLHLLATRLLGKALHDFHILTSFIIIINIVTIITIAITMISIIITIIISLTQANSYKQRVTMIMLEGIK